MTEEERIRRILLFTPCKTRRELHNWIDLFLDLNLPDSIVDPDSNCTPLDMAWDVYDHLINPKESNPAERLYFSARASFKCVQKGTKILSRDSGLVNIEDVKIGDVIWSGRAWRPVTDWIHDGVKEGISVHLVNGMGLTSSPVHRYWAWKPNENLPGWHYAKDLSPEDVVCIDTSHGYENSLENDTDFEDGYLCGILQGDGSLSHLNSGTVGLDNMDPFPREAFNRASIRYRGKPAETRLDKRSGNDIRMLANGKDSMAKALVAMGLKQARSWEKTVPHMAYKSRSAMAGFISGVFDTDGTITDKGTVLFPMTATKMLQEMQVMLAALGVNSSFRSNNQIYKNQKHLVSSLIVAMNDIPSLLKAGVKLRARKASKIREEDTATSPMDKIPVKQLSGILSYGKGIKGGRGKKGSRKPISDYYPYAGVSRPKLDRHLDWLHEYKYIPDEVYSKAKHEIKNKWVSVAKVEQKSEVDFYDLTVSEDHSYWSDGFISHNTLTETVIEMIAMFHLEAGIVHLAAIKEQSINAQKYLKAFLEKPDFREFIGQDTKEKSSVIYYKREGDPLPLTQREFTALAPDSQRKYQRYEFSAEIIVATMQSVNGKHQLLLCVGGDTKITLADKTERTIEQLFDAAVKYGTVCVDGSGTVLVKDCLDKSPRILTVNMTREEIEGQPFESIFRRTDILYRVSLEDGNYIDCTLDHPIFVQGKGFTQVKDIVLGDRVLQINPEAKLDKSQKASKARAKVAKRTNPYSLPPYVEVYTDRWEQVVIGSLLGDCGIYKKPMNNPYLAEQHCMDQKPYMDWKWSIIRDKLRTTPKKSAISGYTGKPMAGYYSGNSPILLPYVSLRDDLKGMENLDALGLAVWYMDDGCSGRGFKLSTEGFQEHIVDQLIVFLWEKFQIRTHKAIAKKKYFTIDGGTEAKRRLFEICEKYIHPDMAYKFDISGFKKECPKCFRDYWHYEFGVGPPKPSCLTDMCFYDTNLATPVAVKSIDFLGEKHVFDCTIPGNNNFLNNGILFRQCQDEIDVMENPTVFAESKNIPTQTRDKNGNPRYPLTVLTSTRKSAFGLVQNEIDNAAKSKLVVKHWSLLDITERCLPERHKPDLPKVKLMVHKYNIDHCTTESFANKMPKEQEGYVEREGYAGCVNCRLFSVCDTRLVDLQKSNSLLLVPIQETINRFLKNDLDTARSQLMCWKPSSEGLVYPSFDLTKHVISPAMCFEMVFGIKHPSPDTYTKARLMDDLGDGGGEWVGAIDWGHTDDFVYTHAYKAGIRLFITHPVAVKMLDPDQMVQVCEPFKEYGSKIYADTEDPKMTAFFKKKGFRMQKWVKPRIETSINLVKLKLRPLTGIPEFFIVRDLVEDPSADYAIKCLKEYHWKLNAAKEPTSIPFPENDHFPDTVRYLIHNLFDPKSSGVQVANPHMASVLVPEASEIEQSAQAHQNQMVRNFLANLTGVESTADPQALHPRPTTSAPKNSGFKSYYDDEDELVKPAGKKGKFGWHF